MKLTKDDFIILRDKLIITCSFENRDQILKNQEIAEIAEKMCNKIIERDFITMEEYLRQIGELIGGRAIEPEKK